MLRLEINIGTVKAPDWQVAWLGDESINMQCVNPVFDTDAGGAFSEEFELDCEMNRHIVGNVDELDGMSVFKRLYGKRFRLGFDGVPVMYGIVRLDKEVEMEDGKVSIELASANREWDELLEGKGLQDLEIRDRNGDRIPVGVCLPQEEVEIPIHAKGKYNAALLDPNTGNHAAYFTIEYDETDVAKNITLPKTLFITEPNTQTPYDPITGAHPFCHIRTCLQKYKPNGTSGSTSWEKYRGYTVHEPEEINSAPCFYMPYVLDRVFDAINIVVDTDELQSIPDWNRLAIVHTNAAFEYKDLEGNVIKDVSSMKSKFVKEEISDLNDNSKFPKRKLSLTGMDTSGNDIFEIAFHLTDYRLSHRTFLKDGELYRTILGEVQFQGDKVIEFLNPSIPIYEAYATSDNLPNIDFSTFLEAIEQAFGARFVYDAEIGTVKIVLMKNVLSAPVSEILPITVTTHTPVQNHITGFRIKYSSSEEIKRNVITNKLKYTSGGDDTTYNYFDYRRPLMIGVDFPGGYREVLPRVSDQDMNLYIDPKTGNAYRVKVDSDAEKVDEWYPSLFEVGGYRDIVMGNCTDEELVEEISIGFTPLISNDVNCKAMYEESVENDLKEDGNNQHITPGATIGVANYDSYPKYAMYMDKEVHTTDVADAQGRMFAHEDSYTYEGLHFCDVIDYATGKIVPFMKVNIGMEIGGKYSYDYTKDEPFNDGECSFMLGVMRGGGSDAHRTIIQSNYDGENNDYWAQVAGSNGETTSDSVDTCGGWFDYNGDEPGLGYELIQITYESRNILKTEAETRFNEYFKNSEVAYNDLGHQTGVKPLANLVTHTQDYAIITTADGIQNVGIYSNKSVALAWLKVLDKIIELRDSTMASITIQYPIITSTPQKPLSLKLKAEKPYKGGIKRIDELSGKEYLETDFLSDKRPVYNEDGQMIREEDAYYPIDKEYAKRGLFDQFYTEYAHFVLNRKIVKMKVEMELATLLNIDMTKKYRIGDVVGWIKQYSYTLDMEKGLSNVEVEMYYL